jgi:tetratricopeptide (TPR) repeat protein
MLSDSIEELKKALELDPNYAWAMNLLGYAYAEMGDFEKAIEYFRKYASISPGDANPFDSMAEIYLKMGRLEEATAKYKEALEIKPDFGSDQTIAYIYALKEDYTEALKWIDQFIAVAPSQSVRAKGHLWKGFYHYWLGSLDQSLSDLRRAAEMAEAAGNELAKARADWMKGWIYYDRGEFELSRRYFKSLDFVIEFPVTSGLLSRLHHKATYSFYFGLIDLKQGQINSAKSRLDEMKSLLLKIDPAFKNQITFYYDLLYGEVLLAENSLENAIAMCQKTVPLEWPLMTPLTFLATYNVPFLKDVLARAFQQKGEIGRAIAEYERLITFDPKSLERFLIHPKYHYRLAKLYEEKDWKGKAIEHYEKFLDLWKDADPSIAEVEESKKRLAGLKH